MKSGRSWVAIMLLIMFSIVSLYALTGVKFVYYVQEACHLRVVITTTLGTEIKTIIDEDVTVGMKEFYWDGTDNSGAPASGPLLKWTLYMDGELVIAGQDFKYFD